jgi:hypothetical protein
MGERKVPERQAEPICEEPLPTGQPCGEPASLIVSRSGKPFNLWCALSEYRRQRRTPNGHSAFPARGAVSPLER